MRKLLLLSLLMVSVCAYARQISEDEAAAIATEFLNSTTVRQTPTKTAVHRAKAPNATEADTAPFYVFNADNSQGFVIVSADDRAQRILGYSDKGTFDFNNLPVQLSDLLAQYSAQLKSIESDKPHPSWQKYPQKSESSDSVLLETPNLGQGAPYNALTPEFNGDHAPTGCTATAVAIIMKYHNWPHEGRGYYNPSTDELDVDGAPGFYGCAPLLPYDLNGATFDWSSMDNDPNRYADIMLAIGRVLTTKYTQDESSASIYPIGPKMHHFFRYSRDCQVLRRSKWGSAEWMALIKSQLDRGYPIIYFTENRHAFVCDGYKDDDYFHFNFGWDGSNNGWYLLDATLPTMEGALDSGMVINLIPSKDDSDIPVFTDPGYISTPLVSSQPGQMYIIRNEADLSKCYSSKFRLYSPEKFKGDIALAFCDKDGNITQIISSIPIDTENEFLLSKELRFEEFSLENSPMDEDFILVYRNIDESWNRVPGTMEASSLIKNDGYVPMVNLKWNIDSQIKLSCKPEFLPPYIDPDMANDYPATMIKGESLFYIAEIPKNRQAYVHISAQRDESEYGVGSAGYHCGRIYENPKFMEFTLETIEDREITIKLISEENDSLIINDNPQNDSYFDNWKIEDFESIKHIKISGHVGFWEQLFIGNWAFGLKSIDYSEADYVSDDFFTGSIPYLQYLTEIQYPRNAKIILGVETQGLSQLTTFVLPESVQVIKGPLWYNNNKSRLVICKAHIPPVLSDNVFRDLEYSVKKSILIVPKGTKHLYQQAEEWCLFNNIIEFEGDWKDYVHDIILVSSISLTSVSANGKDGEQIQISATVLPEDATNKTLSWSSSDENVATVNDSGLVTLIKKGTAVITASATDGSGVSAECAVVVTEYAGIKDILTDKDTYVKIFNLQGIKVYEGVYSEANLAPDYYIVVCDGKNVKVKVE